MRTDGQRDSQTDMLKLIVAFRNSAYVPNNRLSIFCNGRLSNVGAQHTVPTVLFLSLSNYFVLHFVYET
jgi:hypothetical protein